MPELAEVELFRRLLLPLVSSALTLSIELTSEKPPSKFISKEDVALLNNQVYLVDVKRKGKLICMELQCVNKKIHKQEYLYLFVHMGMTGKISTPTHVLKLMEQPSQDYPPKYIHAKFKCGEVEACFSDPRKFGFMTLSTSLDDGFGELAPDALAVTDEDVQGLVDQRLGIKALLLDQKRVMCGVGNWVADEVLYQSQIHPEQKHLSEAQVRTLATKTKEILNTAVECLDSRDEFPSSWLFHVRWNKRSATSGNAVNDAQGRKVVFVTAGGRTSAIVPSIQKLKKSAKSSDTKPAREKKNVPTPVEDTQGAKFARQRKEEKSASNNPVEPARRTSTRSTQKRKLL
jgi:formamidopyrimidine-DNA glycosylase